MPSARACLAVLALLVFAPAAQAQRQDGQYPPPYPGYGDDGGYPGYDNGDDPADNTDPADDAGGQPADPIAPPGLGPDPGDGSDGRTPAQQVQLVQTAQVPGTVARLRTDGRAAIPRGAPKRIRTLIAAMNRIVGKPYVWGGGHARLIDRGYDCSGAVSYGLIGAGMLSAPRVSGQLAHWGSPGKGRWVTVYANKGHVYLEVAGLRLDTSPVGDSYGARSGVRWRSLIGKRRGFSTRHPTGS